MMYHVIDEAKQKVRRHEEQILKLQQERLELLERSSKSEICIQSLQVIIYICCSYKYFNDLFI